MIVTRNDGTTAVVIFTFPVVLAPDEPLNFWICHSNCI